MQWFIRGRMPSIQEDNNMKRIQARSLYPHVVNTLDTALSNSRVSACCSSRKSHQRLSCNLPEIPWQQLLC